MKICVEFSSIDAVLKYLPEFMKNEDVSSIHLYPWRSYVEIDCLVLHDIVETVSKIDADDIKSITLIVSKEIQKTVLIALQYLDSLEYITVEDGKVYIETKNINVVKSILQLLR